MRFITDREKTLHSCVKLNIILNGNIRRMYALINIVLEVSFILLIRFLIQERS